MNKLSLAFSMVALAFFSGVAHGDDLTAATSAASAEHFTVNHIDVTGNTVLKSQDVHAALIPYEGKSLTLVELQTVADGITKLYRDRGFFLAKAYVPAQSLTGGSAHIDVLEGRIGKITVEGNHHYSNAYIQRQFEAVRNARVVHYDTLEKSIRLLNENMDLEAKASLQAGTEPGSTDVAYSTHDDHLFHVMAITYST